MSERVEQVGWVLGYLRDLDADFLAIYGLDLERDEISGPRYFALAHRLTAYSGVMAARAEAEKDDRPASSSPAAMPRSATTGQGQQEVTLTAFRMQFPGLVSVAKTDPEGG